LWNVWDGHLLKVTEKWTTGKDMHKVEAVLDNILCNLSWAEEDAVKIFKTYD
jgi:hypothetical protein